MQDELETVRHRAISSHYKLASGLASIVAFQLDYQLFLYDACTVSQASTLRV
jgi:hypothetical protein